MATSSSAPWCQLFPSGVTGDWTLRLRLVRKLGEPFLLLPEAAALARAGLGLYPAQSFKARTARWLLRAGLQVTPGWVTESFSITTDASLPLARFLSQTAGTSSPPDFAALLGNPRAPGRRCLLLVFDGHGHPAAIVKVGADEPARRLIEAELGFLRSQPRELLRAPAVHGDLAAGTLRAFAMDHIQGQSPTAGDDVPAIRILESWVQRDKIVGFGGLPAAARLAAVADDDARVREVLGELREERFHPALVHGDFAPWNVRVSPAGDWRVLDWERGEASGPPAWDWFHWFIQPEILVRRTPTDRLVPRVEALLASAEFQNYAGKAGIANITRPLLRAYLLHSARVIRQADGLPGIEALLQAFWTRRL